MTIQRGRGAPAAAAAKVVAGPDAGPGGAPPDVLEPPASPGLPVVDPGSPVPPCGSAVIRWSGSAVGTPPTAAARDACPDVDLGGVVSAVERPANTGCEVPVGNPGGAPAAAAQAAGPGTDRIGSPDSSEQPGSTVHLGLALPHQHWQGVVLPGGGELRHVSREELISRGLLIERCSPRHMIPACSPGRGGVPVMNPGSAVIPGHGLPMERMIPACSPGCGKVPVVNPGFAVLPGCGLPMAQMMPACSPGCRVPMAQVPVGAADVPPWLREFRAHSPWLR